MGFDRQLNVLVAFLLAALTFVSCVFSDVLTIKMSLLAAVVVLLAGLAFGRHILGIVTELFGAL